MSIGKLIYHIIEMLVILGCIIGVVVEAHLKNDIYSEVSFAFFALLLTIYVIDDKNND